MRMIIEDGYDNLELKQVRCSTWVDQMRSLHSCAIAVELDCRALPRDAGGHIDERNIPYIPIN